MELDIFLPKENLAFEYQGELHYQDIYALGKHREYQHRDKDKRELCKQKGITLIEIPYWWDRKLPSLVTAIRYQREDLIPEQVCGEKIPEEPPGGFVRGFP